MNYIPYILIIFICIIFYIINDKKLKKLEAKIKTLEEIQPPESIKKLGNLLIIEESLSEKTLLNTPKDGTLLLGKENENFIIAEMVKGKKKYFLKNKLK